MKKKKKLFIIISIILLLIIFKKPIDNIPIRRAITIEEAENIAKTQEGYYLIQSMECSGFQQYKLYNKDTKNGIYKDDIFVILEPKIDKNLSYVLRGAKSVFLVKGDMEFIGNSNAMCSERYKLSVEKWEIISPIKRKYDYTIHERKEYPTDYIDFYDLYHFDYKLF